MNERVNRTTYRMRTRRTWRERLFSWPWRPWQAWRVTVLHVVTPMADATKPEHSDRRFWAVPTRPMPAPAPGGVYAPSTASDDFADTVFAPREHFIPAPIDWPVIDPDRLPPTR
jgi:hypothetical protein